jgi:hypothetical protein
VDELGIVADRYDLRTRFLEFAVQLCQSRKLGCSDKGEISRIKEKYRPFLFLLQGTEAELPKISLGRLVRLDPEVRHRLPYPKTTAMFTHTFFTHFEMPPFFILNSTMK